MTARLIKRASLAALFASLVTASAWAQQGRPGGGEGERQGPPDFFGVGAAVSANTLIFKGGDFQANPFPIIAFKQGRFFSNRAGVGYALLGSRGPRLSAVVEVGVDERNRNEVAALDDMESLDVPIYGGFVFDIPAGNFVFSGTVQRELGLASEGWRAMASVARPIGVSRRVSLSPSLTVQWANDRLSNYLYGVPEASVTADRPFYDTGDSFNVAGGISGVFRLNNRWTLIGATNVTWFNDAVVDSPIVDERVAVGGFLALTYNF